MDIVYCRHDPEINKSAQNKTYEKKETGKELLRHWSMGKVILTLVVLNIFLETHTYIYIYILTHCPYEIDVTVTLNIQFSNSSWWRHQMGKWPFVRGIHRSPVNSPHKGQWRGALLFSLTCAWINGWVNNGEAGDLRRHLAHYDSIVMLYGIVVGHTCNGSWWRHATRHYMCHCWPRSMLSCGITVRLCFLTFGCDGSGSWSLSKWKMRIYLSCKVSAMVAYDLAPPGAKRSAFMALTWPVIPVLTDFRTKMVKKR